MNIILRNNCVGCSHSSFMYNIHDFIALYMQRKSNGHTNSLQTLLLFASLLTVLSRLLSLNGHPRPWDIRVSVHFRYTLVQADYRVTRFPSVKCTCMVWFLVIRGSISGMLSYLDKNSLFLSRLSCLAHFSGTRESTSNEFKGPHWHVSPAWHPVPKYYASICASIFTIQIPGDIHLSFALF